MRMFLALLASTLFFFGCSDQLIPGYGQLVVIDVDDGFYTNDLQVAPTDLLSQLLAARADGFDDSAVFSEMDAVRAGVHYWNKLGANLKLADEVLANEDGPHYGIHRDTFSWPGTTNPPVGTEWDGLPYASIYTSVMRNESSLTYRKLRENVAHEIGHAIGLQHLSDEQLGTMTPSIFWVGDSPSDDDTNAYCKLYPSCKHPR